MGKKWCEYEDAEKQVLNDGYVLLCMPKEEPRKGTRKTEVFLLACMLNMGTK